MRFSTFSPFSLHSSFRWNSKRMQRERDLCFPPMRIPFTSPSCCNRFHRAYTDTGDRLSHATRILLEWKMEKSDKSSVVCGSCAVRMAEEYKRELQYDHYNIYVVCLCICDGGKRMYKRPTSSTQHVIQRRFVVGCT